MGKAMPMQALRIPAVWGAQNFYTVCVWRW